MNKPVVNACDFLTKIETAYKRRRSEYEAASAAWTKEVERWNNEQRRGWRDPLQQQSDSAAHNLKMQQLRTNLEIVERNAAADFEAIRDAAVKTFEPLNHPTPKAVDANVLELLKADVYTDGELQNLAESYRNNVTMLRLVGAYASKRGDKNPAMRSLSSSCAAASVNYMEPLDSAIYYAQCALRSDSGRADKSDAIGKSDGIAAIFDGEFERIYGEAKDSNIFVTIDETGEVST